MATRSRGNGTNFGWLKKSCDISTCDLSPDGNPEKYGRPMKSAIVALHIDTGCSHHRNIMEDKNSQSLHSSASFFFFFLSFPLSFFLSF